MKTLPLALLLAPLALLLAAAPARAEWTSSQIALASALATFQYADWRQTRFMASNPERFSELNPLLGAHPSQAQVDNFFIVTTAAIAVTALLLPDDYRSEFLMVFAVMKGAAVAHNYSIGLMASF